MTAAAFVAYLVNIPPTRRLADWLHYLTPYYYSDARRVLTEGSVFWHQGVLLVAAGVCSALALVAFERREIGVGRSPLAALLGRGATDDEEPSEPAREPSVAR